MGYKIMIGGFICAMLLISNHQNVSAESIESKINRITPAPKVDLYVTSWCPYCDKAKAFFDQRGVEYQIYDIERDPEAAQRKQQLDSGRGVPFAVINGIKISGWSQHLYQAALDD